MLFGNIAHASKFKATPIQKQLKNNIILASDDFSSEKQKKIDTFSDNKDKNIKSTEKLSMVKGILYSALLPGLGERYAGNHTKAKYFIATEILTWVGYVSYRIYAKWKEDDMIRFASEHANAKIDNKDDAFRDMVGFYDNLEQYNNVGRVTDPDRAYYQEIPEYDWQWKSSSDRLGYRALKNRSREAYRNSEFMIGLAVVNRVISMIDAARDIKKANNSFDNETFSKMKLKFDVNPLSRNSQIKVTLYTPF
jgi:hypothetical protein